MEKDEKSVKSAFMAAFCVIFFFILLMPTKEKRVLRTIHTISWTVGPSSLIRSSLSKRRRTTAAEALHEVSPSNSIYMTFHGGPPCTG